MSVIRAGAVKAFAASTGRDPVDVGRELRAKGHHIIGADWTDMIAPTLDAAGKIAKQATEKPSATKAPSSAKPEPPRESWFKKHRVGLAVGGGAALLLLGALLLRGRR